jgi:hypothetical protein
MNASKNHYSDINTGQIWYQYQPSQVSIQDKYGTSINTGQIWYQYREMEEDCAIVVWKFKSLGSIM